MVQLAGLQLVLNGGNGNTMQSNGLEVKLNRRRTCPRSPDSTFLEPCWSVFYS